MKIWTVEVRDDRGAWHIKAMCKTLAAAEESKVHFEDLSFDLFGMEDAVRICTYEDRGDWFILVPDR